MAAHQRIPKDQWPSRFQGYEIGNNGYLLVSFDDGETYFEIDTAKDVTTNHSIESVDSDCRRSGLFKSTLPGKIEISVDAEMLLDEKDNVYRALEYSAINGMVFRLACLTEGGNGPEFYACLSDFGRQEPLSGVVSAQAKYALVDFIHWWTDENNFTDEETDETLTHPLNNIEDDHTVAIGPEDKPIIPAQTSSSSESDGSGGSGDQGSGGSGDQGSGSP